MSRAASTTVRGSPSLLPACRAASSPQAVRTRLRRRCRGFRLSALRAGAVDEARRRLKPQISTVGDFGIPIRDEIELELRPIDPSAAPD